MWLAQSPDQDPKVGRDHGTSKPTPASAHRERHQPWTQEVPEEGVDENVPDEPGRPVPVVPPQKQVLEQRCPAKDIVLRALARVRIVIDELQNAFQQQTEHVQRVDTHQSTRHEGPKTAGIRWVALQQLQVREFEATEHEEEWIPGSPPRNEILLEVKLWLERVEYQVEAEDVEHGGEFRGGEGVQGRRGPARRGARRRRMPRAEQAGQPLLEAARGGFRGLRHQGPRSEEGWHSEGEEGGRLEALPVHDPVLE
mmetsp:Transcript_125393/g.348928  ORF Transcript_125393/g.348928 Transcript_125393/m.348928 type:complete len:254 (-) Transcript_125393:53-814(-)